jgi:hypothetical protein
MVLAGPEQNRGAAAGRSAALPLQRERFDPQPQSESIVVQHDALGQLHQEEVDPGVDRQNQLIARGHQNCAATNWTVRRIVRGRTRGKQKAGASHSYEDSGCW